MVGEGMFLGCGVGGILWIGRRGGLIGGILGGSGCVSSEFVSCVVNVVDVVVG